MKILIAVRGKADRGKTAIFCFYTQLFSYLSYQGVFGGFPFFYLAARKFPIAGKIFALRAPGQQDAVICIHKRDSWNNKGRFIRHGYKRGFLLASIIAINGDIAMG